jgi:hypothetical protein
MWYYDEYAQRWYIDLHAGETPPERERSCEGCQGREQIGIDACMGCAG